MIHRARSFSLAASLALLFIGTGIIGCGGGDGGGTPGKLSDALLQSFQRSCQKAFDCKPSYVPAMHSNRTFEDFVAGSTVEACANSIKTLLLTFNGQDYLTKLDASVAAGRVKYNPMDYDTCIKAGEAESCDQFFHQNGAVEMLPAACDTVSVGQVATGGSCTLDADCAGAVDSCDTTAHTCG